MELAFLTKIDDNRLATLTSAHDTKNVTLFIQTLEQIFLGKIKPAHQCVVRLKDYYAHYDHISSLEKVISLIEQSVKDDEPSAPEIDMLLEDLNISSEKSEAAFDKNSEDMDEFELHLIDLSEVQQLIHKLNYHIETHTNEFSSFAKTSSDKVFLTALGLEETCSQALNQLHYLQTSNIGIFNQINKLRHETRKGLDGDTL